ncbi:hypothetical protein [Sphingobacterium kyonggiense]|uniref:HEAT repeat domain-containing protein n=1 Tax=Sphingobacterium kyonggiense TaxID=714075 RepID=UPI0031D10884
MGNLKKKLPKKMDIYLTSLIERTLDKSDREIVRISSESISWKALREAEKIDDENYITQLVQYIETEKEKEKRDSAYFILGHIANNTKNKIATDFLIERIEKEKDKSILSSLLDRIKYLEKTEETDIQPIINATKSKVWSIRQSAISALSNAKNSLAENTLLEIINNSIDEYDLYYANCSLLSTGTKNSISSLVKLLDHKKQDVSGTALSAILNLSDSSNLSLFVSQLEKGKNKFTALLGVIKFGDTTVIPNVVKRVKELVSKKRTRQVIGSYGKTELIFAMEFLSNFASESDEPKKTYDFLTTKKADFIWDNETEWLLENKSKFVK